MSTLTQLRIEPPLQLPKMGRLPLIPVLATAAAVLYVAGVGEFLAMRMAHKKPPQATVAQAAEASEVHTFAQRWAPIELQQAQPRGSWIDPYSAPAVAAPAPRPAPASAEPRIYEQDEFNFLDEQAAEAKRPSRSESKALARQEVCAMHGLRKVFTDKHRWRCKR